MQNPILKENNRSWQRFNVLLTARYFLDDFSWYREGVIIDISRQGASINLPIDEKVALGNRIILEVVTKQLESITIKGEIIWIKQFEKAFLIGVRFKKLLDFNLLGKLH
jgi:hypothetical protein